MIYRPFSNNLSQLQALFGEFVISDNGMTLNHDTGMLFSLQCCDNDGHPRVDHPQCAEFFVPSAPKTDESSTQQRCMRFTRSIACTRCKLGPRMISSSVTAAQDLNSVYGVSDEMLMARRTMTGGLLKSQLVNGEEIFATEKIDTNGVRYRCFEGKCELSPMDVRNLLAPTGLVFSLLFHRNHNRHARNLAKAHPKWSDEKIFQMARRWNIAEYQHSVYNEYLQTLIGEDLMRQYAIYSQPPGEFSYYEDDVAPKTIVEFQSTAARHGHTTIIEDLEIVEPDTLREYKLSLRDADVFERIFYEGLVDGVLFGQIYKPAIETTPSVPFKTFVTVVRNADLAALDIQRQRDHGIPSYIYYLQYFHNINVQRWEDLQSFIDWENIEKLKRHYKYVEDIELYVGGNYERKIHGAVVGPTFANIIAIQFHNAKYGDRFFYEHAEQIGSFSVDQLDEIKINSCFASILCKNSNLNYVLRYPFFVPAHENPFVSCSEFNDIDYKL